MSTTMFVNLPVRDLERAKAFFTALGLDFFGMTDDMASVVINDRTQVMLLAEPTFATYAQHPVARRSAATEVILVLAQPSPDKVDDLVAKAVSAGGAAIGEALSEDGRYQRGFADPDGHQWSAMCLVKPE